MSAASSVLSFATARATRDDGAREREERRQPMRSVRRRVVARARANEGVNIPTLLNNTPHARTTRQFFYDDCTKSVVAAVTAGEKRIKIKTEFPELNVSGDVYRVGTTLELVRHIATALARDGKRVKICVQRSMGQGVFQALPLSLSGVSKLLGMMDWEEDVVDAINPNGAIGADVPEPEDNVFLLVQPQNIVGYALLPYIEEMEAVAGDRPMIMLNPKLDDIQSAGNVMSIRGRAERMESVARWRECYHFRLLYRKPYFHPIYGALRFAYYENEWEVYKRTGRGEGDVPDPEKYRLIATHDVEPTPDILTKAIWG
jgi:adenylate kinase|mmetsp:Transcript_5102/g.17147  ORF Transcript_5102/g.17147 Transcript_5102/m.17147 type:complete len:316 (+) Transcript_5102:179-1126(+)